jgi:hypothetical protein
MQNINKKIKIGVVVLGAVIFIFVVSRIFSGDSSENKNEEDGNQIADISTDGIKDEEIKKMLEEIKTASEEYKEQETTSIDKIHEAWESQKISAQDYALFSLEAIYGGITSLPNEYAGVKDASKDHAFLYGLIHDKWNTFSEETKEKIRPFILNPKDPKSYFYGKSGSEDETNAAGPKKFSIIANEARAEDEIIIEPAKTIQALPRIEVLYFDENEKQSAEWAAQGIRDSAPKFTELLGIDYKSAQVTIVGKELGADGEASMDENIADFCHIKVRKQKTEKGVKTTAAHELFHCYQFWMGLIYEKPDTMWLMEATAVWSEDFVYKGYNSEHGYHNWFFPITNIDMMSISGDHEYGSYLWYYFLEQKADAHEIYDALKFGKINGVRAGTQIREKFGREYREFALWNWNRDPFKRYIDDPFFPTIYPYYKSVKHKDIREIGDITYPIKLDKGGMNYNFLTFDNEDIKSIEFYPANFTGNDEANTLTGLQVFYKVNGNWNYEDWTGVEKRNFCRDLPDEDIELIVLTVSNANLNSELNRDVLLKTAKKCAPGWRGTISVKWERANSLDIGFSKGTYAEKGEYRLYETLEYDSENDSLVVADQQYFANYEEKEHIDGADKSCGQMWSTYTKKLSGSGFVDYKKSENMPERAEGQDDKEINKFGGTYDLFFKIFGLKDGDKFHGSDLRLQLHKKCSPLMPGADGLMKEPYEYDTDVFKYEPNEVEITIDPKAKTISGEDKFEIHDNVFGTVKWNYRRID